MFVKTPMDRNSLWRPQLYYTRSGIVFPGKGQERLCQVIVGNLPTSFFPYDIFSVFGYAK